ncbi:MAG TPA: hypothetical protein PKA00_13855 [Saprospiraceae bacterium]|nr:hypothetical protein [Saprospiraceae bacterium]
MKQTALIILLGNRDVQIPKLKAERLESRFAKHLVDNNEGEGGHLIVQKSKGAESTFLEISKMMWDDIAYFYDFAVYPMLEATLDVIEKAGESVSKVYLSTSKQTVPHQQDSFYFAEIVRYHLEKKGIECELQLCPDNPNDFPAMVAFYTQLFENIGGAYEKIFVSNSGGTPTMRSASHFAGIFRKFEYITISSEDKSNLQPFRAQENIILSKIVNSMLQVFDYEGIVQLPIEQEVVKGLAEYALARIALDFKLAKKKIAPFVADYPELQELVTDLEVAPTVKILEKEMFMSAKIKFHQRNYTDYLWRLFTIYDNTHIPFVELALDGRVIHNRKTKFQEWKDLLSKDPSLLPYLEGKIINKEPLRWEEPNKFAYIAIFDHYYPKDSEIRPPFIDDIGKCLNALSNLRNAVAHNFGFNQQKELEGIGIEEMEGVLLPMKKSITELNHLLSSYLGLAWDDLGVYGKLNTLIKNHFHNL